MLTCIEREFKVFLFTTGTKSKLLYRSNKMRAKYFKNKKYYQNTHTACLINSLLVYTH